MRRAGGLGSECGFKSGMPCGTRKRGLGREAGGAVARRSGWKMFSVRVAMATYQRGPETGTRGEG